MANVSPHSASTSTKARVRPKLSTLRGENRAITRDMSSTARTDAIAEAVMTRGRVVAGKVVRNRESRVALAATTPATRAHAQAAASRGPREDAALAGPGVSRPSMPTASYATRLKQGIAPAPLHAFFLCVLRAFVVNFVGTVPDPMKLALRFPASAENASDHARLAVSVAREEFDLVLDYSPGSLEDVDAHIESLREDGFTGEDAAEALFVFGCYVGEVMVRAPGRTMGAHRAFAPARPLSLAHGRAAAYGRGLGPDRQGLSAARAGGQRVPSRLLRGRGAGGPRRVRDDEEERADADADAVVVVPITGELDLHAFSPRDIPSVVEDYVAACQGRGILALRLVHGKGKGVQRAVVHRVLRDLPAVVSFGDAPAERGGFGATLVTLRAVRCVTRALREPSSVF